MTFSSGEIVDTATGERTEIDADFIRKATDWQKATNVEKTALRRVAKLEAQKIMLDIGSEAEKEKSQRMVDEEADEMEMLV